MKRLLLVRHAEPAPAGAPAPTALSGLGAAQAEALAARLAGCRPAALYTSPVRRAAETALVVGGRLGLQPTTLGLLGDSATGGPGRGQKALDWLLAQQGDGSTAVAVTHLPLIRLALCALLGLGPGREGSFACAHASVTALETGARGLALKVLNDTSHLRGLLG